MVTEPTRAPAGQEDMSAEKQQENSFSHKKAFLPSIYNMPGFFLTGTAVITLPAMTSSDEEGPSWLSQSTTGKGPFRLGVAAGGLFLTPVEHVFTCEL